MTTRHVVAIYASPALGVQHVTAYITGGRLCRNGTSRRGTAAPPLVDEGGAEAKVQHAMRVVADSSLFGKCDSSFENMRAACVTKHHL